MRLKNLTVVEFIFCILVVSASFQISIILIGLANQITLLIPHLIIITIVILIEKKTYDSIFSPLSVFCYIYTIVILSSIITSYTSEKLLLRENELLNGSTVYLLFLSAVVFSYYTFRTHRKSKSIFPNTFLSIKKYYIVLSVLGILGLILRIILFSTFRDYSIIAFFTDPQVAYWEARADGRNLFVIFTEFYALLSILIIFIFNNHLRRRYLPSKISLYASLLMIFVSAFLSGNKTGFFWPFVGIIVIEGFYFRTLKGIKSGMLLFVITSVLLLTFTWRGAISSLNESIDVATAYNHIFFYTSKAVSAFKPDFGKLWIAVKDLGTYAIPRLIWKGKPMVLGLVGRYLEYPLRGYTGGSYSTMGLSEIWISAGYLGVIFSGFLMGLILLHSRNQLLNPTSLGNLIFATYSYGSIYFILRVGFLNTYIFNLIFVFVFLKIVDIVLPNISHKTKL